MKKRCITFIVICIVFFLILLCLLFSTPSVDIIYTYQGNSYIQNTRSLFRHKVTLHGYTNITNVLLTPDGWFCCAKKANNKYFLFVTEENEIAEVIENSYYYSCITDVFLYNNRYSFVYDYQENAGDKIKAVILSVDFSKQTLIYQELPAEFSAYSIVANDKDLYGSNSSEIYKYENGTVHEIAKGSSVICINGNDLLYEYDSNIYQYNLMTQEIIKTNYNLDLYSYRTVDFISKLNSIDHYIIGCKIGFIKDSNASEYITHTTIFDTKSNKEYVMYGSLGKTYENIQIVTDDYNYNVGN